MEKYACYIPFQQMVIDSTGNVSPCPYIIDNPDIPNSMGNVNDNSIIEVWNSKPYQRLREYMHTDEGRRNGCPGCKHILWNGDYPMVYPDNPDVVNKEDYPAYRNFELLMMEISERKTVLTAKPTIISYTPSHRCNYRCIMCYQQPNRNAVLANPGKTDSELMEILPYMLMLIPGGGEPFLQDIWKKIIAEGEWYAKSLPFLQIATTTNGSLVDEKLIQKLERFSKVRIGFSYDGSYKELFEEIRIHSNFDIVHKNLMNCLAHSRYNPNFKIRATMTVMKQNIHDVCNMIDFSLNEHFEIDFYRVDSFPFSQSIRSYTIPEEDIMPLEKLICIINDIEGKIDDMKTDSMFDFPRHQLEDLISIIPKYLMDRKHYIVRFKLPEIIHKYIMHLDRNAEYNLCASFVEQGNSENIDYPFWWTHYEKNGGGIVEAYLPDGFFFMGIGNEENYVPPKKWLHVTVKQGIAKFGIGKLEFAKQIISLLKSEISSFIASSITSKI